MKEILYDWGGVNQWLFLAINGLHSEFFDQAMLLGSRICDASFFPLYLATASLCAIYIESTIPVDDAEKGRQKGVDWLLAIGVLSLAYLVDGILADFIKEWFNYPPPATFLPSNEVHLVGNYHAGSSLPSAHASFAMLLAASLWPRMNHFFRPLAAIFVIWVGFASVNVGEHFPADIAAGYLLGFLLVLLLNWIVSTLFTGKPRYS